MLHNGCLAPFSTSEPFHNSSILVPNVSLNNALHSLNFVETVVKSDDLTDQLGTLRHQILVNRLIDSLKSIPKGLLHVADAMQLSVMRSHDRAVVAQQLFAGVTKVTQRF